jgi:hypothetical protein
VLSRVSAPLLGAANVPAAQSALSRIVHPLMLSLTGLASLICTFFLVQAGIAYVTSSGRPDKLESAKRLMRNALMGLTIVLAAGIMATVLTGAYASPQQTALQASPSLTAVDTGTSTGGIVDVLIKAIVGLFRNIIESAAEPFIKALDYFTKGTPLMGSNSAVFELWAVVVGLTDTLFVLVVALLGFHVMSAASLGLDEIDIKHMMPQLALTFLLINTSIFLIDAVISVSNGLIIGLSAAFGGLSVWSSLLTLTKDAGGMGLVALIIMVVFIILAVILMVYYVSRLVALYVGAILSPLIGLLLILPGFRDFAITAIKSYITNIFVLFVHVVILLLAASIFAGLGNEKTTAANSLMATILGIATLCALIKTQGVMTSWSYASIGPRAMRRMGQQFINGVSYSTSHLPRAEGHTQAGSSRTHISSGPVSQMALRRSK